MVTKHAGEARLGLSSLVEVKNHRHLTTSATRDLISSLNVHSVDAQIFKRDCPDETRLQSD